MKTATELISDIGSKAFVLQRHSENDITKAVKFLRAVNGPMFDWLVRVLSDKMEACENPMTDQAPAEPRAQVIAKAEKELHSFPPEIRALWTYENPATSLHACLRDLLALLRVSEEGPQPNTERLALLREANPTTGLGRLQPGPNFGVDLAGGKDQTVLLCAGCDYESKDIQDAIAHAEAHGWRVIRFGAGLETR